MFFHILKKDLKRKKAMNIILFIFIVMATMFLASSVNNLVNILGEVDHYVDIANVPDYFTMALAPQGDDPIEDYLKENKYVTKYQVIKLFNLADDDISLKRDHKNAETKAYKKKDALAVSPIPNEFLKVYEQNGNELTLKNGEIAIPKIEAEDNDIQVGDKFNIQVGKIEKEFIVKQIIMDATFGNSMMGYKRFFITDEDFDQFQGQDNTFTTKLYCINYNNEKEFQNGFKSKNFNVFTSINKSLIKTCYVFDISISVVLIVVSVCLILISFLILRFTIVFTLQEDYKEIGIMKAIGMKDKRIKEIYMIKYLALSIIGALIGFLISFPFGDLMMKQAVVNILVQKGNLIGYINILCSILVVVVVLIFCYGTTNKLKKYTVMEAIRNGSNGERYKEKNRIKLHHSKYMRPCFYMALNDILSSIRRFITLGIIFVIGTQLILLPLGAVTTLKSPQIINEFSMISSQAFIDNGRTEQYIISEKNEVKNDLEDLKHKIKKAGYEAEVWAEIEYFIPTYAENPKEIYNYLTLQCVGDECGEYKMLKGKNPKLSNEVMITEKTADEMGVEIGDSISFKMSDGIKKFIITGIYQTLVNMGNGYRVSKAAELDYSLMAGLLCMQVNIKDMSQKQTNELLPTLFPSYKIRDYHGYMKDMLGSVMDQLDLLQFFITTVVLIINALITYMMVRAILTKEHGEISMLKSIGMRNQSIKAWQTIRVVLILVLSIIIGTIISNLLMNVTIGPIFGIMGAKKMQIITDPYKAYFLYPLLLLIVTGVTAYYSSGAIKKVDLKEINNME